MRRSWKRCDAHSTYRPPQSEWVGEKVLYEQVTFLSMQESGYARLYVTLLLILHCYVTLLRCNEPLIGEYVPRVKGRASAYTTITSSATLVSSVDHDRDWTEE